MESDRLIELSVNLHRGLPRLGPGSDTTTLQTLAYCDGLPPAPAILDIGCGTGAQNLVLAALPARAA
jgi:hypothetical protein